MEIAYQLLSSLQIINLYSDEAFNISFNVLLLLFTLLWVLSVFIKNVSIVDIVWGAGNSIQALIFYIVNNRTNEVNDYYKSLANLILVLAVTYHGYRLSIYLAIRNLGHGEDKRYVAFRKKYGEERYWWVSFFQVFLLQLFINMLLCSHLNFFIRESSASINIVIAIFAVIVTFLGSLVETVADLQLWLFKKDPKNKAKILNHGLWALCRHPNYLGELIFWWGTYLFNCSIGQYYSFYPVLLFTIILYNVSGVKLTEKGMKRNNEYEAEYKQYLQSTSKIIPYIW